MQSDAFVEAITPWLTPSDGPLRAHLSLAIRQAVGTGHLVAGARLPPERTLARALNVSRPTISAVIDDLRASGLVESRQGSGSWISAAPRPAHPTVPFVELLQSNGSIDLAAATAPDASLLPPMRVDTADLLGAEPANGLTPLGMLGLRGMLAERHREWVPDVAADNVVITSGAHQALALLTATLAPRGSTVLVEEPTYGGLIDMIRANGCLPIAIERDDDGPIPESLEQRLVSTRPALTILVSSVHSPTGRVSPPGRDREVAAILEESSTRIVLDETYAALEFEPSGRMLSRLLAGRAIRVGSLSKAMWTGLRTGWIIADHDTCATIGRRRWEQFDLGPSIPAQLFAAQALAHDVDMLESRRAELAGKALWLTDALNDTFPSWSIDPVDGGLAMWVSLDTDGREFADLAAERGVAVLPGEACRVDRAPTPHVRICFDRPHDVLEAAVERLAG